MLTQDRGANLFSTITYNYGLWQRERKKKQKTKGNSAWDIKGVVKDFVLSCTIKTGLGDHKIEESPAN